MVAFDPSPEIVLIRAGLLPYDQALQLQECLWDARRRDECGDRLILLQHPPVITLGESGGLEDVRASHELLQRLNVELFQTNRGGRATYHGPGQLVAYPIMKLHDRDLHAYLWKLEEVALRLLAGWGIHARREERYPGVWIGKQKIAAVGVSVREDVTTHGLALNANTDLSYFDLITPCGIQGRGVTSMQAVLGRRIPTNDLEEGFVQIFSVVFDRPVVALPPEGDLEAVESTLWKTLPVK